MSVSLAQSPIELVPISDSTHRFAIALPDQHEEVHISVSNATTRDDAARVVLAFIDDLRQADAVSVFAD